MLLNGFLCWSERDKRNESRALYASISVASVAASLLSVSNCFNLNLCLCDLDFTEKGKWKLPRGTREGGVAIVSCLRSVHFIADRLSCWDLVLNHTQNLLNSFLCCLLCWERQTRIWTSWWLCDTRSTCFRTVNFVFVYNGCLYLCICSLSLLIYFHFVSRFFCSESSQNIWKSDTIANSFFVMLWKSSRYENNVATALGYHSNQFW